MLMDDLGGWTTLNAGTVVYNRYELGDGTVMLLQNGDNYRADGSSELLQICSMQYYHTDSENYGYTLDGICGIEIYFS